MKLNVHFTLLPVVALALLSPQAAWPECPDDKDPTKRGIGCHTVEGYSGSAITENFTDVDAYTARLAEIQPDLLIDNEFSGGAGYIVWYSILPVFSLCPTHPEKPEDGSNDADPAALNIKTPKDDSGDGGGGGGGCSSCGGQKVPQSEQSVTSPTAMNIDMGLGRSADGKAFGRLRFGFDFDGSATTLRKALSLQYAPQEGKFVLDEYQPGSHVITRDTAGRPLTISNSNAVISFTWSVTGGMVDSVSIAFAQTSGVVNTPRAFTPATIKLSLDTSAASPELTITHKQGLTTKKMIVTGTAQSRTHYSWTIQRFDGSTVDGDSHEVSAVEGLDPQNPTYPGDLAFWRSKLGDPAARIRHARLLITPADALAPATQTDSIFKLLLNDAGTALSGKALLKERTVSSTSNGQTHTETTTYTHHENPPAGHPELKNLVASITHNDGSWVAYPAYDAATSQPTVELRPWMSSPATAEQGLANPAACLQTEISWETGAVNSDLIPVKIDAAKFVFPEWRRITRTTSQNGNVMSVTEDETNIAEPKTFGGPFAVGGELECPDPYLVITKRRTIKDGSGLVLRTTCEVLTEEEVFGNPNDSLFSGFFDSDTGTLTVRKTLTDQASGSFEEQTYAATIFGSFFAVGDRWSYATRHLASSGGGEAQEQKIRYNGTSDFTGTVVSSLTTTSSPTLLTVTKDGAMLRQVNTSETYFNDRVTKVVSTTADGGTSQIWTDALTGQVVKRVSPDGVTSTVQQSGLRTSTTHSGNGLLSTEYEDRDAQGRSLYQMDRNKRGTRYQYSPDGLTTTITYADLGTRITSYYLDGRIKSVTGSAVVPEYHTFIVNDGALDSPPGVSPAGSITEEIRLGTPVSPRVRWITRDSLGRVLSEKSPAPPQAGGAAPGYVTTLHSYTDPMWMDSGNAFHSTEVVGSGIASQQLSIHTFTGEEMTDTGVKIGSSVSWLRDTYRRWTYSATTQEAWETETRTSHGMGSDDSKTEYETDATRLNSGSTQIRQIWRTDGTTTVIEKTVGTGSAVEKVKTGVTRLIDPATGVGTNYTASLSEIQTRNFVNGRLTSVVEKGATMTHSYDGLGHWTGQTGGPETISRTYRLDGASTTGEVASETRNGVTTTYQYDDAGRVNLVSSPAGTIRYAYNRAGRITHQWGATYPVAYTYSSLDGQMISMKTFQDGSAFLDTSTPTPPAAFTSATAATTYWTYDPASGALIARTDEGQRSVNYRYDSQGRLSQKLWARGVIATYSYDTHGRLSGISYNDGTPAVTYTYNLAGQLLSMADGSGTHSVSFGPGELAAYPAGETWSPRDASGFTLAIARPYALTTNAGTTTAPIYKRKSTFSATRAPAGPFSTSTLVATERTMLADGRFDTVLADNVRFTYGYDTRERLQTISVATMSGTTATAVANSTMTRTYDSSDRLQKLTYGSADSVAPASRVYYNGWQYGFDAAGRRQTVLSLGTTTNKRPGWTYAYNARGEVSEANRYDATSATPPVVSTQDWRGYSYDGIGNRTSMTPTGATPATAYQVSSVDPTAYSLIQRPAEVAVSGHYSGTLKTGTTPTVTVADAVGNASNITPAADSTALADAGSWRRRFSVTNPNATVGFFAQQTVSTLDSGNLANSMKTWVYVPPTNEVLLHDEDGNLIRDARWDYHWDGEGRLVVMEERASLPAYPTSATVKPPRQRLEFLYDGYGRRTAKRVYRWDSANSDWQTWAYTLFVYEGWNVVAELDMLYAGMPQRTYTWGPDLSGSMSGAGGVGGLLMVKRWQRSGATVSNVRALVHSDGNGNVMGFYGLEAAKMLGVCDYDAFGQKVLNTVAMGNELCPIGFSSKYEDKETGLLYYGFRYYSPELGRWLNRDPIEEDGGINLYGMLGNDLVNNFDFLGMRGNPRGPGQSRFPKLIEGAKQQYISDIDGWISNNCGKSPYPNPTRRFTIHPGEEGEKPRALRPVDPAKGKDSTRSSIPDSQFGDPPQGPIERALPISLGSFVIDIEAPVPIEYKTKAGDVGENETKFEWKAVMYVEDIEGEVVAGIKEHPEKKDRIKIFSSGVCRCKP